MFIIMKRKDNIELKFKNPLLVLIIIIFVATNTVTYSNSLPQKKEKFDLKADNLYNKASDYLRNGLHDTAIVLYKHASAIYENSEEWDKHLNCQLQIGNFFFSESKFDSASFYTNLSEETYNLKNISNKNILAEIYFLKGEIFRKKRETDSSSFYLNLSLDICITDSLDSICALINKSLGNLEYLNNRYDKALTYYNKALEVERAKKAPSENLIASLYQNIGIIQSLKGNYDISKEYFKNSLQIKEKLLTKDDPHLANIYLNFGRFLNISGHLYNALDYYNKA